MYLFQQEDAGRKHSEDTAVSFHLFMAGADTGRVPVEEAHGHGALLFQATREANHGDIAEGRQVRLPSDETLLSRKLQVKPNSQS